MATGSTKGLDEIATKYELPGKIMRDFQSLHSQSPATAKQLVTDLAALYGVSSSVNRGKDSEAFNLISGILCEINNVPLSKDEIADATKLKPSTIHTCIYRSHQKSFEALPSPSGGKAKVYRLTEESLSNCKGTAHEPRITQTAA